METLKQPHRSSLTINCRTIEQGERGDSGGGGGEEGECWRSNLLCRLREKLKETDLIKEECRDSSKASPTELH